MAQPENSPAQKDTPNGSSEEVASPPRKKYVSWPPPGLEQAQGLLWPIILLLGLGDFILILPLLWAVAGSESTWSHGPFRDWWILAFTSGLGLFILLVAVQRMFHLLTVSRRAEMMGHGFLTIAQTAIDSTKDMGALVQGGRAFAHMEDTDRESLLRYRLVGAVLFLAAALWIPLGFTLSLLLAARGMASPGAVWYLTLLPAIVAVLAAFLCRVQAGVRSGTVTLKVRRTATEYMAGTEVEEWSEDFDRLEGTGALRRGPTTGGKRFRTASIVLIAVTTVTLIPLFVLFFGSATTPLLFATPRSVGIVERVASVEFLRQYRLRSDYSITAEEAGEALQSLNLVANRGVPYDPLQKVPARKYTERWGMVRTRTENLFERFLQGEFTEAQLTNFSRAASHPALQEFRVLARAAEADLVTTRWNTPFPDTLSGMELRIPRMTGIIDGAYAQIVKAAMEYNAGRHSSAESLIREVISTGFLLIDEDPLLIGNLVGTVIVNHGGEALESFYMVTGKIEEAGVIHSSRDDVARAVDLMKQGGTESPIGYERMAGFVSSESTLRGLRWEFLIQLNLVSPVLSPHKAVFGRGEDFDLWKEDARTSLARWPGEEELFRLAEQGWLVSHADLEKGGLLRFTFGMVFGRSDAPGSLVSLIRSF